MVTHQAALLTFYLFAYNCIKIYLKTQCKETTTFYSILVVFF